MSALLRNRVKNSRVKAGKAHPEWYRHGRLSWAPVPAWKIKMVELVSNENKKMFGILRGRALFFKPVSRSGEADVPSRKKGCS